MNRASFLRQVAATAAIVVLLLPLSWLSQPATSLAPGGVLARKRAEYRLGQASLGQIDPASEALKLSLLGMRSVAGLILWNQADEQRIKEDWTSYRATLDQLVSLQPNYIGPWLFQAQNLSYNIASEFDDYRDRYYWAIEGLKFLQRGAVYNEHDPRLLERIGWFACNKFGKSDERMQFRKMFRDDDDFHKLQTIRQRDNWLFGREYYLLAEKAVESQGLNPPQAPVIFHNWSNIALGYQAEALALDHLSEILAAAERTGASGSGEDSRFQSIDADYHRRIVAAWAGAQRAWDEYGSRQFLDLDGHPYRLNDLDRVTGQLQAAAEALEALAPGVGEALIEEKRAQLPDDQKAALQLRPAARTKEQQALARLAEDSLLVSFREVAARAPAGVRPQALSLAEEATRLQTSMYEIRHGRSEINLDQWLARCAAEQSDDARFAWRDVFHARAYFHVDADCVLARQRLEAAFLQWRRLLDTHPWLKEVGDTAFAMVDAVQLYRAVLRQLDEPFPAKFILQDLLDAQQYDRPEVLP